MVLYRLWLGICEVVYITSLLWDGLGRIEGASVVSGRGQISAYRNNRMILEYRLQ